MNFISDYCNLDKNRIHFLDSKPESNPLMTPLLICPGLSETAEEYEDLLIQLLPRRVVVLSFRGRGKSDSPLGGYDLNDHIQDIEDIVSHLSLESFNLFAYSRGVSFALGYMYNNPNKIKKVILQDYPPEHKQMSTEWADDYIHNYLIPFKRTGNISEIAVNGIARDATQIPFNEMITKPVLILRGMLEGTLITEEDVQKYKELIEDCTVIQFFESGHDIRSAESDKQLEVIQAFLNEAGE